MEEKKIIINDHEAVDLGLSVRLQLHWLDFSRIRE